MMQKDGIYISKKKQRQDKQEDEPLWLSILTFSAEQADFVELANSNLREMQPFSEQQQPTFTAKTEGNIGMYHHAAYVRRCHTTRNTCTPKLSTNGDRTR
jgi:hypothetical protein